MFPAFLGTSSASVNGPQGNRVGRLVLRSLVATAAAAALIGATGGYASAETDTASTVANVEVSNAISLTDLTPSFTLTGIPGASASSVGAVTLTVETNNFAGYAVTVEPTTLTMAGAIAGNTDTIPTESLQVRETGTTDYANLAVGTALQVHTQASASAEGGDDLSNDFRITVPFVRPDTYAATLDYIATTL